jgi:hypothetical protein
MRRPSSPRWDYLGPPSPLARIRDGCTVPQIRVRDPSRAPASSRQATTSRCELVGEAKRAGVRLRRQSNRKSQDPTG